MTIHPGDLLADYRVTRLLGRGGMGEVWAALDPHGAEVAVKVLLATAKLKPDIVTRFEREALLVGAIDSPFVCKLLGHANDQSGALILVFEKLEGESLSERLAREKYLPFAEVGPLVDDMLEGLAAAHRASVIHRDLKPANVFLTRTGDPGRPERAQLLDFGISKLARKPVDGIRDEPSLTDFDSTLGSFAYMAPEQVRNPARVDHRADLYSVGAVAFAALAGRLPFEGKNAASVIALKMERAAPTLEIATGERWPSALERFLSRALDREPNLRFESAEDALAEWRACLPVALVRRAAPPPARVTSGYANEPPTAADTGYTATETGDAWGTIAVLAEAEKA
ncbi:MAG: serine/threonine protein kinase [Myxococcales bacterium]|nr:serine/threonine protein kinase [Myxococcales bacterium]